MSRKSWSETLPGSFIAGNVKSGAVSPLRVALGIIAPVYGTMPVDACGAQKNGIKFTMKKRYTSGTKRSRKGRAEGLPRDVASRHVHLVASALAPDESYSQLSRALDGKERPPNVAKVFPPHV